MAHYSDHEDSVRVDFFKPGGKWYCTEAVRWTGAYAADKGQLHDAFAQSLRDHFADCPDRLAEMDAICLEPYHEYGHPIQLKAGKWLDGYRCNICKRPLNDPNRYGSKDCGGDCLECVAEAGDPLAREEMFARTSDHKWLPEEE